MKNKYEEDFLDSLGSLRESILRIINNDKITEEKKIIYIKTVIDPSQFELYLQWQSCLIPTVPEHTVASNQVDGYGSQLTLEQMNKLEYTFEMAIPDVLAQIFERHLENVIKETGVKIEIYDEYGKMLEIKGEFKMIAKARRRLMEICKLDETWYNMKDYELTEREKLSIVLERCVEEHRQAIKTLFFNQDVFGDVDLQKLPRFLRNSMGRFLDNESNFPRFNSDDIDKKENIFLQFYIPPSLKGFIIGTHGCNTNKFRNQYDVLMSISYNRAKLHGKNREQNNLITVALEIMKIIANGNLPVTKRIRDARSHVPSLFQTDSISLFNLQLKSRCFINLEGNNMIITAENGENLLIYEKLVDHLQSLQNQS